MSQVALSMACELARPTISKIERDETTPSALSKQKIADALGFQVHEVFPSESPGDATGATSMGGFIDDVLGIAVTNGLQVAAGVRGGKAGVAVKGNRIEGFLIDHRGEKLGEKLVHLINDGEKIDTTVSSREGRFVFDGIEPDNYVILAGEKYISLTIDASEDEFSVEI